MIIDIICPLYQAEQYIEKLHESLLKQKNVNIGKIKYILTKSSDKSEEILNNNKLDYEVISKNDFSHSLVRERAALKSNSDIVCFISQDIVIEKDDWLENLVRPIINGEAEATYSRQLTKISNIEKYTREYNYPENSIIKSKEDIKELGLKTFFFSDASSAVKTEIFKKLNGYDGKKLPINEDMYLAYKLIMNDYRIKYCADSVVYHSHHFSLKQLYDRYKLTGIFLKENTYLDKYGTTSNGGSLAKYILKRIIQEKKIELFVRYPFDMAARLIGMKVGKS